MTTVRYVINYLLAQCIALACLTAALYFTPATALAGSVDISSPLLIDLRDIAPLLEKSVSASPTDPGLRMALGAMYINLGAVDPKRLSGPEYHPPDFSLAEKHLIKATSLSPNSAMPHYYLGLLALHRQDHDKAIEHLMKALELDPKEVRIHQQVHTIYFASRKYATAALFLESSVKVLPGEANLYHRLAVTYLALNRAAKGRENANKALSIEYNPETRNLLAALQMQAKNYLAAEAEFRKVLKRSPGNLNAILGIARTYEHRGKSGKAKLWIGKALSIDRENPEALLLLEEIQKAKGKKKQPVP